MSLTRRGKCLRMRMLMKMLESGLRGLIGFYLNDDQYFAGVRLRPSRHVSIPYDSGVWFGFAAAGFLRARSQPHSKTPSALVNSYSQACHLHVTLNFPQNTSDLATEQCPTIASSLPISTSCINQIPLTDNLSEFFRITTNNSNP
jgi:hypothetical protein